MRRTTCSTKTWINLAFCISLAGLTNHSPGEIVYKKLAVVEPPSSYGKTSTESSDSVNIFGEDYARIARIEKQAGKLLAVLEQTQDLQTGSLLETQRLVPSVSGKKPIWVTTGLLKLEELRPDYALASVTEDGSVDSTVYFKDSPGIMAGDRVVAQNVSISQQIRVLPTITLLYKDLFLDPKGFPLTFELSDEGMEQLKSQAKIFLEAKVSTLVIEAHTDHEGNRQANQMESYQRALTVRQILVDEMGFDPERVVALGMGESEPLPERHLPGMKDKGRRIVLKVNNHDLR